MASAIQLPGIVDFRYVSNRFGKSWGCPYCGGEIFLDDETGILRCYQGSHSLAKAPLKESFERYSREENPLEWKLENEMDRGGFTKIELAQYMGIARSTLYQMLDKGGDGLKEVLEAAVRLARERQEKTVSGKDRGI